MWKNKFNKNISENIELPYLENFTSAESYFLNEKSKHDIIFRHQKPINSLYKSCSWSNSSLDSIRGFNPESQKLKKSTKTILPPLQLNKETIFVNELIKSLKVAGIIDSLTDNLEHFEKYLNENQIKLINRYKDKVLSYADEMNKIKKLNFNKYINSENSVYIKNIYKFQTFNVDIFRLWDLWLQSLSTENSIFEHQVMDRLESNKMKINYSKLCEIEFEIQNNLYNFTLELTKNSILFKEITNSEFLVCDEIFKEVTNFIEINKHIIIEKLNNEESFIEVNNETQYIQVFPKTVFIYKKNEKNNKKIKELKKKWIKKFNLKNKEICKVHEKICLKNQTFEEDFKLLEKNYKQKLEKEEAEKLKIIEEFSREREEGRISLEKLMKENYNEELKLRKKIQQIEAELEDVYLQYDEDMFRLDDEIDLLELKTNTEEKQLKVLKEKFSILEVEYNEMVEERRKEKERKEEMEKEKQMSERACFVIQSVWRAYKVKKSMKNKKKKKKKNNKQRK